MIDAPPLERPGDLDAGLDAALALFWHPVCTLAELRSARPGGRGPLRVRLLGRDLAVADLDGTSGAGCGAGIVALDDRCAHRSTRLSVGTVDELARRAGAVLRCSYHGWCYAGDGSCVDIPSMPGGPIPVRARVGAYAATVAHDLVWVRIDSRAGDAIGVPACPAWGDPSLRVLAGEPYSWPVGAPRRVENFVDLAHFAWVHDGSLGRRDEPVPELPDVTRAEGEMRFTYEPPAMATAPSAMFGWSSYRMPLPATVSIEFRLATGARRWLWMTASPLDASSCRCFWFLARDDDLDGDDEPHLAFQRQVLAEDEPVVCNQVPGAVPLDWRDEVSVRTDRVSIEYRRWLRELADAALDGPDAVVASVRGRTHTEAPLSAALVRTA